MKIRLFTIIVPLAIFLLPKLPFCNNDKVSVPDAGEARFVLPTDLDLVSSTIKLGLFSYEFYPRPFFEIGALYLLNEEGQNLVDNDWLWLIAGGLWFRLPIEFPNELRISGGYLSTEQNNIRYSIEIGNSLWLFQGFELTIVIGYGTQFSLDNSGKVHSSIGVVKESILNW